MEAIKKKDLLYHEKHGFLKVTGINFEGEKIIECLQYDENGRKNDTQILLTE